MTEPSRPYPGHLVVEATLRDTDLVGHVNNGVYLNWFEEVRTRYIVDRIGSMAAGEVSFIMASIVSAASRCFSRAMMRSFSSSSSS